MSPVSLRTEMVERRLRRWLRETPADALEAADPFTGVQRVLVLAPHFDDEVIACGGAVLAHSRRGQHVRVVYLTDGSASEGEVSGAALSALRREEAGRSAALLGIAEQRYLDQPDGGLAVTDEVVAAVRAEVAQSDLVYAPHAGDAHPDHQATYQILQAALAGLDVRPAVLYYEFWRPLRPNFAVDVSAVMGVKERALAEHRSQLQYLDYVRLMKALQAERGALLGVAYAEAYRLSPAVRSGGG